MTAVMYARAPGLERLAAKTAAPPATMPATRPAAPLSTSPISSRLPKPLARTPARPRKIQGLRPPATKRGASIAGWARYWRARPERRTGSRQRTRGHRSPTVLAARSPPRRCWTSRSFTQTASSSGGLAAQASAGRAARASQIDARSRTYPDARASWASNRAATNRSRCGPARWAASSTAWSTTVSLRATEASNASNARTSRALSPSASASRHCARIS